MSAMRSRKSVRLGPSEFSSYSARDSGQLLEVLLTGQRLEGALGLQLVHVAGDLPRHRDDVGERETFLGCSPDPLEYASDLEDPAERALREAGHLFRAVERFAERDSRSAGELAEFASDASPIPRRGACAARSRLTESEGFIAARSHAIRSLISLRS